MDRYIFYWYAILMKYKYEIFSQIKLECYTHTHTEVKLVPVFCKVNFSKKFNGFVYSIIFLSIKYLHTNQICHAWKTISLKKNPYYICMNYR